MQLCPLLLLLLLCGTAAAVTLGASVRAPGSGMPQTQQQCVINRRKIMTAARRYYKAQYGTKLLLLKLRVHRQQLLEKRQRYQAFLQRMRLRHKARIHRRILRFKRQAKKARRTFRRKLRYVAKKFQRKVMRKLKVKPLSNRRILLIKKAFFKKGIISRRAAKIARKPIKITPTRLRKVRVRRMKVRRLMTRTRRLVRSQVKHQIKKLRLNKCCRGRGKRHILRRRIRALKRLLLSHIRKERQRRKRWIVRRSRRSIRRKLRKITRRAKRSRRRATRRLRRIQRKMTTQRSRRSIQKLRLQRRRIIKRIVSRRRLIRRIAKRRRQVIRRLVRVRNRGKRRRFRRLRRQGRRSTMTRRRSMLRQRVTRRRHRSSHPRRRIARKVTRTAKRIVAKVRRALRSVLIKRRTLVRIRRRRVALKRRVSRILAKRRSLKRRVAAVRARRARLLRRMRLLRLRRAKIRGAKKVARKQPPTRPLRMVSVKRTAKLAKRTVRRTVRINKRLRRLASRVSRCSLKVYHLKQRRVHMKERIFKFSTRRQRLRQRFVVMRKKSRRQVRRLRKLIAMKRRFIKRVIRRRLVRRKTIRRIIIKDRRAIRRTVSRSMHKRRRTARRHRQHVTRPRRRLSIRRVGHTGQKRRRFRRTTRSHDRSRRRFFRRTAILKSKRVLISGTKVVIPRLVTAVRHRVPGMRRKVTLLRRLSRKLHSEWRKVTRRLNTRSVIRKIVLPQRIRLAIRASVKKALGGKRLLKVTKTEAMARKILRSRKPGFVRNLKTIQANLRRQLVQLTRGLATATPALKNLVQQKKAAYASAVDEVRNGFSRSITESKEVYGKLINRQKWLYNTEYETLVSEEYKTSEEEIDPKTQKWIVKSTATVWSHFSVGCFKDAAGRRDLKLLAERGSSVMSLSRCRDQCRDRGFPFFGVQNGSECRCGSSYGSHGAAQPGSCGVRCSGNKAQVCGGHWHNSVYSTGLSGYKMLNVGCFHDKSTRDLPKLAITSDSLTLMMCAKSCGSQSYKYFGVQNSRECWCGNTYGRHGPARSHKCDTPCGGDKKYMCGGAWLNSVYKTGLAEGGSVTQEIAQSMSNGTNGGSSQWTETSSTSELVGEPAVTTTTVASEDKSGPAATHETHSQHGQVITKSSTASKAVPGKSSAVQTVNPDGSTSWTETSETHVADGPIVTKGHSGESSHTVVSSSTKST